MKRARLFDVIKGKHGLCWRCENRAKFHDTGYGPRCECGDVRSAKYSCYCYEPTRPLVLERDKGERRSLFLGWMLSGRGHAVGVAVSKIRAYGQNGMALKWHEPITIKQKDAEQKKADKEWKRISPMMKILRKQKND